MTDWPTAELHVHLEGTVEVELLVEIARRNGVALPTYDAEVLRARYAFTDLQSFLDILYANLAVLRTEQDFHDLAAAYLRRAQAGGVRRAEMFFDQFVRRVYEFLGGYIRKRQREGAFIDIDPAIVVRSFIGMVMHHSLNNNLWDPGLRLLDISNEDAARHFTTILLNGITAPSAKTGKGRAGSKNG